MVDVTINRQAQESQLAVNSSTSRLEQVLHQHPCNTFQDGCGERVLAGCYLHIGFNLHHKGISIRD